MAHRYKVRCPFRGHDPRDPGHAEDVALGDLPVQDEPQRGGLHGHPRAGNGLAGGLLFAGNIDHARRALFVEMGKFLHQTVVPNRQYPALLV